MSLGKRIVDAACDQREQAKPLLLVMSVMAVLLVVSFPFLEPQTPAYNIAIIDAGIVVLAFVLFGGTFWYCTRREMDE